MQASVLDFNGDQEKVIIQPNFAHIETGTLGTSFQ